MKPSDWKDMKSQPKRATMKTTRSPLCAPRTPVRQQTIETISAAGRSNMSHRIDVRLSFVGCLLMVLALLSAQGNVCSAAGDSALLRVHYPAAGHSVTVRGSAGGL